MSAERAAVLLIAHGSPERAEDVPAFMRNVTGCRPVPPGVMEEVQHRYKLIGRSPLRENTEKQARALGRKLDVPVYFAMRNWKPFISEVVRQMIGDGITRVAAICLAPQNSRTSVGLYRQAVFAEAENKIKIDFVESWHDHPLLIAAFAEKLLPAWRQARERAQAKVPIIFTAHSVPERTISEGDSYQAQANETGALVAARIPELTPELWRFAFQSQGMSGGNWIGPTVEEAILDLKATGHRHVLVQPVGFVCDHVEVLYDVDIGFAQFARNHGMELTRTESLNDSPLFIEALAALACDAMQDMRTPIPMPAATPATS